MSTEKKEVRAAEAFGWAMSDPDVYNLIVAKMKDWDSELTEQECYDYINAEIWEGEEMIPII